MDYYDIGSSGYGQVAAIADAITRESELKLRNLPSGTDIGRLTPVKIGTAHFKMLSAATVYCASNGLYNFAAYEWGPQSLRQVWSVMGKNAITLITAKDAGITTPADLKGKRMFWIPGHPASQMGHSAVLAFSGLTWDDVVRVEMPAYGAACTAISEGKVDAGIVDSTAAAAYQLEASPRGIHYPLFPPSDKEGWDRMLKVAPYMRPVEATVGAGLSEENPIPVISYPYPVVLTYDFQDNYLVYTQVKAIHESFDLFKDAFPVGPYWQLEKAVIPELMLVPYHDGAIQYFKEIGWWNQELQVTHEKLLAEQQRVQDLWKLALEEATTNRISSNDFPDFWMRKFKE